MTFLGTATNGQRDIAARGFRGQRDTLGAIVTAEAAIGCAIVSPVCAGALTVVGGVDCAQNPGVVNCGTAAVGVAIPVVRAVRGAGAAGTANAASAADEAAVANRAAIEALDPANAQILMRTNIENYSAPFQTIGASTTNIVGSRTGEQLISAIQAGTPGLSRADAIRYAEGYYRSGALAPVATPISSGTVLIKIVPSGQGVSPTSGYFMTVSEFNTLRQSPSQIASRLGLPLNSHAVTYDVYQVTARSNTTVFTSTTAPTLQGTFRQTGGATQTIVPNRSAFTTPVPIVQISGR
jgi:hypothetical protein